MRLRILAAQLLVTTGIIPFVALAQPARPPGGGPGASGFTGSGFHARHMKDQLAAIQEHLGITDDAWAGLRPKIERVLVAKQNLSTGAGITFTSQNGAKPSFQPSSAKSDTPTGKAMQAVREAVEDPMSTDMELKNRLKGVREARKKARTEYEAAQEELAGAITTRQQAVLMTLGVVE